MLHENPWMADIDVDHWRNLQSLVLESAKGKRRIVVIHEDGRILKFVHSQKAEIVRNVSRVDRPRAVAEKIFRANADKVDFVAVFERKAVDRYFARFQDTWRPEEDLDAFVHRTYATLDEFPDGIVTFPGPAREVLGLQWKVGARYADLLAAAQLIPAPSTVVLGVFEGHGLWATLVLSFDADRRIHVVTTVDPSELLPAGTRQEVARGVVGWVNQKYGTCSLGLFMGVESARALLSNREKARTLREIAARSDLLADPVPPGLAALLKGP